MCIRDSCIVDRSWLHARCRRLPPKQPLSYLGFPHGQLQKEKLLKKENEVYDVSMMQTLQIILAEGLLKGASSVKNL